MITKNGIEVSDLVGGFTGDGGVAQDDSVKSSLDLAHTDIDAVLEDTGTTLPTTISTIATAEGTMGILVVNVSSSTIPTGAQSNAIATCTGGVVVEEILLDTDGIGLTGPTTVEFTADNVYGAYLDEFVSVIDEAVINLGANVSLIPSDFDTNKLPVVLEDRKALYIQGDDGSPTGTGFVKITIKYRRLVAGAKLT